MVDRTVMQSGRYKAYPKYKDSGAEWLGKIPNGWEVLPIKYVANVNMGQSPSSDDVNDSRVGLPFLQGNADFSKFSPKARTWCPVPRKIAKKGEVLFSVRAPVGAVNVADMDYGIGRGLCSIKGNDSLAQDFLAWLLPSYKYQFDAVSTGSTFESVSSEEVNNLLFSLPSLNEQKKIANFLDYETAKIDTLIEKQQHLIELLTEKRQAVISHAVTKGLNPDVPMKDSGVEWLGEVPEHWIVTDLKRYCKVTDGSHYSPKTQDEGYPFISVTDVGTNEINFDEAKRISDIAFNNLVREGCKPAVGDILLTKDGTIGRACIVDEKMPDFVVLSSLGILTPYKRLVNSFLYYYLISGINIDQMNSVIHGSAIRRMTISKIDGLIVTFPTNLREQEEIASYLNDATSKINQLLIKARESIQLMQERRTALISAAVTGKIDVRDWVKPE